MARFNYDPSNDYSHLFKPNGNDEKALKSVNKRIVDHYKIDKSLWNNKSVTIKGLR